MKNCIVLDTFDRLVNFTGFKQPVYNLINLPTNLPKEKLSALSFGLFVHLSPALFFILLVNLSSFSLIGICGAFIGISTLTLGLIHWSENKHPSTLLTTLTTKDRYKGLIQIFMTAFVIGTLFIMGSIELIKPHHLTLDPPSWTLIILALVLTDLSYYWIHRTLNHSKKKNLLLAWFRKIHTPHHAIKALDFYRGNLSTFFDTAITGFQIPLIVISLILNLQWQETMSCYFLVLILQSTHHANYTFHIGFLRYVFVDNHSHKLHHCPRGYDVNFGAIFAIWDIFFRTYYEDWNLSSSYLAKNHIAIPIKREK